MSKKWKVILVLAVALFGIHRGKILYNYFFDTSFPVVACIGLEPERGYSGVLTFSINGEDEYCVKSVSVLIDNKPVIDKHVINSKKFSMPFSIQTFALSDGKHDAVIKVVDSARASNETILRVPFYVDNEPLDVKIIKSNPEQNILQGNTLHMIFQSNKSNLIGNASVNSYEIPCIQEAYGSTIYECFIPVSTEDVPNECLVSVVFEDIVGNKAVLEDTYKVIFQNFKKKNLVVPSGAVESDIGRTQGDLESEILIAIKQSPNKKLWNGRFCAPCIVKSYSTDFGTIRTSKEKGRYRHDAIDICASPRSPVWACQDGVVVVKDYFKFTGNTVVIDHGCGIITLYSHMDSFADINVGDFLKKGNMIGYIGMTGYATGYHLHLELRIKNVLVNPLEWISSDL
jgi:hypothetical protein